MAAASSFSLALLIALSLSIHSALGSEMVCEDLSADICAFSVSSAGRRCLLETSARRDGTLEYQCKTSEVVVEKITNWIETDECVRACGVDRKSVGISSDALMEHQFTAKLCSQACTQNCPNIIDLYYNLAAGEDLCELQRTNPHRAMVELLSSGAASGPVGSDSSDFFAAAPVAMPPF
ncbi:hypothetical protein ACLOJK_012524 [Asimina triloba]